MKPSDIIIGQKYFRINEDGEKVIYLGIGQKEDIKIESDDYFVIEASRNNNFSKNIKLNLIILESKRFPKSIGRIVYRPGHKKALKGFWDTIKPVED